MENLEVFLELELLSLCAYKTLSWASLISEYLILGVFRCFEICPLLFFYSVAVATAVLPVYTE